MAEEELIYKLTINGSEKELRTMQELNDAADELENTLRNAQFGSEAFKQAEAELKKVNAQVFEFDKRLEGLQDPVKSAERWVKYGEGVAGAFAAAQGAAVLFGIENENIEKLVARAQGATAIAVGARALAESQLISTLKASTAGKYLAIAADKAYAIAIGTSTGALKLFRLALVATGLGAVAVGVGILVANWDKFSAAVKKSVSQLAELLPGLSLVVKGFETVKGFIQGIAEDVGLVASEEEKAAQAAAEASAKWYAEEAKRAVERDKKQKEEAEKWAAGAEARKAAREKEFTEAMELSMELDALFTELVDNFNARQEEAAPVQLIDVAGIGAQLTGIDAFIAKKRELDALDDQIVENQKKRNEELTEVIKKVTEEENNLRLTRIQSFQEGVNAAQGVIGTLGSLADAFSKNGKKNEKIQRVLTVTQIALDTAKGISGAVAAGAGQPFPANLIAIASGIASVLAGIASAKAALSKAPGGGGDISLPSAPTFQAPQTEQRQGQSSTSEDEFGSPVFKTYVLGSEVSSSLEARQRVEDIASLGG
jgi:hypothetical protein